MWKLFFVIRRLTSGASRLSSVIRRSETNRTLFRRSFSPGGSTRRFCHLRMDSGSRDQRGFPGALPPPRSFIHCSGLVSSHFPPSVFPHFHIILLTVRYVLSWPFSYLITFVLFRTLSLIFSSLFFYPYFFFFQGKFLLSSSSFYTFPFSFTPSISLLLKEFPDPCPISTPH